MPGIGARELLEADFRVREFSDWRTDFWTAFLLVVVTCGIYSFYILYKLMERRQQHFERIVNLRVHLIEELRQRAAAAGRDDVEAEISELEGLHLEATMRDRSGERSPMLWLLLHFFAGVTDLYVFYFLNDDFRAHEANEQRFMGRASDVMMKLGMISQPLPVMPVIPERNFVSFLIFSLITCGVYLVYWWYTLITDPNNHFDNHVAWEQQLQVAIKTAS